MKSSVRIHICWLLLMAQDAVQYADTLHRKYIVKKQLILFILWIAWCLPATTETYLTKWNYF